MGGKERKKEKAQIKGIMRRIRMVKNSKKKTSWNKMYKIKIGTKRKVQNKVRKTE